MRPVHLSHRFLPGRDAQQRPGAADAEYDAFLAELTGQRSDRPANPTAARAATGGGEKPGDAVSCTAAHSVEGSVLSGMVHAARPPLVCCTVHSVRCEVVRTSVGRSAVPHRTPQPQSVRY